jgi:hypothetical protein
MTPYEGGRYENVVVDEDDETAGPCPKAGVARPGRAGVLLAQDAKGERWCRLARHERRRGYGRSIVHNYDFDRLKTRRF